MTNRDWRSANMPKWALDAANDELESWKLTAALSWPNEIKPEPLPFRWGEYDRMIGEPVPGTYWSVVGGDQMLITKVEIRKAVSGYKPWEFRTRDGAGMWTNNVRRGPLYATENDARLAALWIACEKYAERLADLRGWL